MLFFHVMEPNACSCSARIASVVMFWFLGLATWISIVIGKCSLAQDQSRFSFTLTWINVQTKEGYAICPLSVAMILHSLKSLFPALLVSKKIASSTIPKFCENKRSFKFLPDSPQSSETWAPLFLQKIIRTLWSSKKISLRERKRWNLGDFLNKSLVSHENL